MAAAGAVALAVGGIGTKWGDDVGRLVRASPDHPPTGGGPHVGGPIIEGGSTAAPVVKSEVDAFVQSIGDGITATPVEARQAATSAACNVLYIAWDEGRLPSEREWTEIAVDALAAAAIDARVGSPAWRELERLKDSVAASISDSAGFPQADEVESAADQLACALA